MTFAIHIDGHTHEVSGDQNLLQTCLELGYDLPYFCWHPALGSIGACRQCAVRVFRDEKDQTGRIVMACMTPLTPELRVRIDDPEASKFRKSVIEWLMTNHPHDCPICDEGGECHLQDMSVMCGHNYRRTRFRKRTFENQDLGPFINHEMNRCIQCYRCVRFYADYAGGRDLQPFSSRNRVWFGRFEPGKLENPFSGNLVEVCPTGVFTDKTLKRHYTRKWDLQSAPSVCPHCSLGCNIFLCERYGLVRRVLNRYHDQINGNFLCDRGRFGYDYINGPKRIRIPLHQNKPVEEKIAFDQSVQIISNARKLVGIGSPRASLEANYLLQRLVGRDQFVNGMSQEQARVTSAAIALMREHRQACASLGQVEYCDAALILGEDVTNTAPRLALALRQTVKQKPLLKVDQAKLPRWDNAATRLVVGSNKGPVFIATPMATWLDDIATTCVRDAPDDIAELAQAITTHLNQKPGKQAQTNHLSDAKQIAEALASCRQPLIVVGCSLAATKIIQATSALLDALTNTDCTPRLFVVFEESNSVGVNLLESAGTEKLIDLVDRGADTLLVLENDLSRRLSQQQLGQLLSRINKLIVLDYLEHDTSRRADVVLPTATVAESNSTRVNNEARAQRVFQIYPEADSVRDAWNWLIDLGTASKRDGFEHWVQHDNQPSLYLTSILHRLGQQHPVFEPLEEIAFSANRDPAQQIARQSHRYSGRTAMQAHLQVSEPRLTKDQKTPFSFSMEGRVKNPDLALHTRYWAPGWNSNHALHKEQQTISGTLLGADPSRLLPLEKYSAPVWIGTGVGKKPQPFGASRKLLCVAVYHLFGSEELSSFAGAISQLAPEAYVALSPGDMEAMGVSQGDTVTLVADEIRIRRTVRCSPELVAGVCGLACGLPTLEYVPLPLLMEVQPT